ncbi:hypothetical protein [Microbacterium sp.]|uniref:hypothetical protein n=1 Tax=Microbacterium sp. TaxID=51671 RepID=UPI003F94D509
MSINLIAAAQTRIVEAATGVSGNTVGNWLADNVIFVMIVLIAIAVLCFALTKKVRDAMVAFGICLLGLVIVFIGLNWRPLAEWLGNTFLGG